MKIYIQSPNTLYLFFLTMGPTHNTQSPQKAGKPEDWTWAHFYKHPDYASR